jgi:hypothetical protein
MNHWPIRLVCTLIAGLAAIGCGDSPPPAAETSRAEVNLQRIGAAYAAVAARGRPPRNAADLARDLQAGPDQTNPSDLLRSPNDNQEYVIVWGVDFRALAMQRGGNVDVVLAYERTGKDGKRLVLKPPALVSLMTDEEFRAAAFPPGHTPAR